MWFYPNSNFPNRQENILDLVFTTHPSLVQHCEPIPGISDHDMILTTINSDISYPKPNSHCIYLWNKANLQNMSEDISKFTSEFTNMYALDTSVDNLWCSFRDKLLETINTDVPCKIKSKNSHQPWINRTLKQLRRHKQCSYNRARSTNLPTHWLHYKKLKKEMQKECRKSYNEYMSNIIHESYENGKKKKLFSYIKSLRADFYGVDTLQKDDVLYPKNQYKANLLNQYFASVFTSDDGCELPDMGPSIYPNIPQIEITTTGITELLRGLDPSKASGPDKIPGKLLKIMASEISPCLLLIFSASLHQGTVPQDRKQALVTPLFKKGNRKKTSNYRPISLTCICCKILEHIIHTNIMSHLETNNTLSNAQFGFHKHHSAELQLIQTSHDFALCLHNKSQTDAILLDFSKAFDKVLHRYLILKLQYYDMRSYYVKLDILFSFKSYSTCSMWGMYVGLYRYTQWCSTGLSTGTLMIL